ncbi:hypothetical protein [Cellulosimicrobium cellulans]|uniref:hypothetical protein n=1 Tax=Cellulosimicrobium cellulans TaxID=1710 RepID=UPI002406421D|nr:hypothetical protein [Cellulosimicrobium cellulans]MDF9877538.1 hypothetical protein [Cellulosimicrobium cellulans]
MARDQSVALGARPAPSSPSPVSGRVDVASFTPSDLELRWDPDRRAFAHQYDRDLQMVAIWSNARPHEDEILDILRRRFHVLAQVEVRWSPDRVVTNFERLYGQGLWGTSPKPAEVGAGPFLLVVVEDPEPRYAYRQNVSGYLELTNVHMAEAKAAARRLAGGYTVHSSNNLREFFRDTTVVLGPGRLDEILARDPAVEHPRETLDADLVGDAGWSGLDEVAAVLRRASEYVVLRNFEGLPGALADDPEIDVLARDQADLAALLNARPLDHDGTGARFGTTVGGLPVAFDVRWVGDGYLDVRWQDHLLRRRTWTPEGLPVPRGDDHLFSLLYHAKVQKPAVKPAYVPRLSALARDLDLPAGLSDSITDDDVAARVLDGFLSGHGYTVPRTVDRGVHRNEVFVASLRMTEVEPSPVDEARAELVAAARRSRVGELAARSDLLRAAYRHVRDAVAALRRRVGR